MIDSHYFSENYTGFELPVASTFHETGHDFNNAKHLFS